MVGGNYRYISPSQNIMSPPPTPTIIHPSITHNELNKTKTKEYEKYGNEDKENTHSNIHYECKIYYILKYVKTIRRIDFSIISLLTTLSKRNSI